MKRGKRQRMAAAVERQQAAEAEEASYIHSTIEDYEADQRPGAKLIMADGSVLAERCDPPGRPGGLSSLARLVGWASTKADPEGRV